MGQIDSVTLPGPFRKKKLLSYSYLKSFTVGGEDFTYNASDQFIKYHALLQIKLLKSSQ